MHGSDQHLIYSSISGVNLFENIDAFPRVFSVHEAVYHSNAAEIPDQLYLLSQELDRKTILPTPPPPLERCAAPDSVQILAYHPDSVRLSASMGCRGMVILSDAWYPGWRAFVDGHAAPIHKAYGFLRGVVVPAGRHTVEFRYRPWSFYRGAALTLLATLIASALFFLPRRRFRLH